MEKIYNILLETKQNIFNRILEKQDKERLLKIKNLHKQYNINRLAKDFYHQADEEIFFNNNPSQAELLYKIAIDVALDDMIMEARELLENNEDKKAIELYNELLKLNYTRAKYDLGDLYLFNDKHKDIDKGITYHQEAINVNYIASNGSLGIYYLWNDNEELGNQYINKLLDISHPVFMLELLEKAYRYHMDNLINKIQSKMDLQDDTHFLTEIIDFCFMYEYNPRQYIDILLKRKDIHANISLIDVYLKHWKIEKAKYLTEKIDTLYYDIVIAKYLKNGYLNEAINYTKILIENYEYETLKNVVKYFMDTKPDPLLNYYPNKAIIEVLDKLEEYVLDEDKEVIDILLSIYIENNLLDKANKLFDKTSKENNYRYTVSLLKTCLLYNHIDKANLVFSKILADNSYSEMINLLSLYLSLNMKENAEFLKNIILKAKDKYYHAKVVSPYLEYHYNQEAYTITKEVLKSFHYCYEHIYDYTFIYTLINSYLENKRVDEIHDISLYVLQTTDNKFKIQRLYFSHGYEDEYNDLLKEL